MQKIKMGIMATFALLGASVLAIPTEGLVFRLDASDRAHILENADGYVTNWLSSACDPAYAATHGRIGFIKTPDYPCPQNGNDGTLSHGEWPFLNAAAYGGRGAMRFGFDKDGTTDRYSTLRSDTYTTNRTVVLVFQWTKYKSDRYTGGFVLWGMWGKDFGVGTVATGSQKMWLQNTAVTMGGNIWLNGGRLSDPTHTTLNESLYKWDDNLNKPIVLITECTEEIAAALGRKQGGLTGMYTELCLGSYATYAATGENVYSWIDVAEFISYDRVLTAEERAEIDREMRLKWEIGNAWVGGASGSWSEESNWKLGVVPGPGDVAVFNAPVELTFSEDAVLSDISGGVTFDLQDGAVVQCGDVDLQDGTLAVSGEGRLIGTTIANGRSGAAGVVLTAMEGKTLAFDAAIAAGVALEKRGDGRVTIDVGQDADSVTLSGGMLSVVSNLAPAAISGLALHLDAGDAATLTVDGQGYVRAWRSKTANGLVFTPNVDPEVSAAPIFTDRVVGKAVATPLLVPGVRFGAKPGDALTTGAGSTKTSLAGDRAITHGTIFAVCETLHRVTGSSAPRFYGQSGSSVALALKAGSFGNWGSDGLFAGGRAWVNGYQQFSGTEDKIEYQRREPDLYERYHQLTVEIDDGLASKTFAPVLGGEGDYSINGTLCEMIVYDRQLTDAERQRVERYLLDKWLIRPQPGVVLPTEANPLPGVLTLTADAALDLNGYSQAFDDLTLAAGTGTVWPVLSVLGAAGGVDLSSCALKLTGASASKAWQTILSLSGGVATGGFSSLDVPSGVTVVNRGSVVKAGERPGLILLFR